MKKLFEFEKKNELDTGLIFNFFIWLWWC